MKASYFKYCALSSNEKLATYNSGDEFILIWDMKHFKLIAKLQNTGSSINHFTWLFDGNIVSIHDNAIKMWDVEKQSLRTYIELPTLIYNSNIIELSKNKLAICLEIPLTDNIVAIAISQYGMGSNYMQIWNINNSNHLANIPLNISYHAKEEPVSLFHLADGSLLSCSVSNFTKYQFGSLASTQEINYSSYRL